jgi:large subunit ribosomal protein L21e
MAKRIGGLRRKSRGKFSLATRERGKISLTKFFQEVKPGDKVMLKANPAYQKGLYMPRFHGRTGIVKGKRGACYEIVIRDMAKQKSIVVHPLHFVKV